MNFVGWAALFDAFIFAPAALARSLADESSTEKFLRDLRDENLLPDQKHVLARLHVTTLGPDMANSIARGETPDAAYVRGQLLRMNPFPEMQRMSPFLLPLFGVGYAGLARMAWRFGRRWGVIPGAFLVNSLAWARYMCDGGLPGVDVRKYVKVVDE